MKAVFCNKYADNTSIELKEIEKPMPKENEILIQIYSSTVQTGDWRIQSLNLPSGMRFISRLMFGLTKLRKPVLGTELSGVVEAVGEKVSRYKPGDQVIATTGMRFGAHAEYIVLSEDATIAIKPAKLSFQEAAALPFGGLTALDYLKNKANLKKGEKVLINGASGSVGIAAVQVAKFFGAEITAVCSKKNFDLVKASGADRTIDYHEVDFRKTDKKYDIILDTVGHLTFSDTKNSLNQGGRLLLVSTGLPEMLKAPFNNRFGSKKVIVGVAAENSKNLGDIVRLAAEGHLKSVIDREYSLDKTAEAFGYIAKRHKKGNVVLNVKSYT